MAVYSVEISLISSYDGGENVPREHFVDPLEIAAEDLIDAVECDRGRWAASRVVFPPVRLRDYASGEEPAEAMHRQLDSTLALVARFLDGQPSAVFDGFRERGLDVHLFIGVWMDQDQMELTLPPSVLKACGRHGLRINLISNDVSAAELLADDAV